jgi:hypothetical protein
MRRVILLASISCCVMCAEKAEGVVLAARWGEGMSILVAALDMKPILFAVISKQNGAELFGADRVADRENKGVVKLEPLDRVVIQFAPSPFSLSYGRAFHGTAFISYVISDPARLPWGVNKGTAQGHDWITIVARTKDIALAASAVSSPVDAATEKEWSDNVWGKFGELVKDGTFYAPVVMP